MRTIATRVTSNFIIVAALVVLSTSTCFAFTIKAITEKPLRPVVALGAGPSYAEVGTSKSFPQQDPVTSEAYNYSVNNSTQSNSFWNAFMGVEWLMQPSWLMQAGLDYSQSSPFLAHGNFTQGADAQSADYYAYQYQVVTRQLLLAGKLLYNYKTYFHPYILAGIGSSFNTASQYTTNVPFTLTFTRRYASNTATSFSYALGLGVDTDLTQNLRVGIGYRFASLGQAKLGNATINTTRVSGTLSQSNLYANEILVQLSVIFA